MILFKRIYRNYESYMIRRGREEARTILLSRDDRTLSDLGFSRELLESGVEAWPWEAPQESPLKLNFSALIIREKHAIGELESLTDTELHDLGISRGSIPDAVKQGRPGFEIDQERNEAA